MQNALVTGINSFGDFYIAPCNGSIDKPDRNARCGITNDPAANDFSPEVIKVRARTAQSFACCAMPCAACTAAHDQSGSTVDTTVRDDVVSVSVSSHVKHAAAGDEWHEAQVPA